MQQGFDVTRKFSLPVILGLLLFVLRPCDHLIINLPQGNKKPQTHTHMKKMDRKGLVCFGCHFPGGIWELTDPGIRSCQKHKRRFKPLCSDCELCPTRALHAGGRMPWIHRSLLQNCLLAFFNTLRTFPHEQLLRLLFLGRKNNKIRKGK